MGRSDNPFPIIKNTNSFWVAKRPGEDQRGRVGGFPELERAVRGAPEDLRGGPKGVARKVLPARKNLPARELDYNAYRTVL